MTNQKEFRRALLHWYRDHGRDLPWRRTRDSYRVLVSEIMLQQTQVATVLPYYNRWLRRFPNFNALARADEADVLHAWQGLGYYNRARNLWKTARLVEQKHGGEFPSDVNVIHDLPGIGKYTAHAVACFAFDRAVPIVEANTSRVLSRLSNLRIPIDQSAGRKALWDLADKLAPRRSAHAYNSALMDLGALICLPQPKCRICPVKKFCRAKRPETLPLKKSSPATEQLLENHAFIVTRKRILLEKAAHRWRGLWILPPLKLDRFKRSSLPRRPIHQSRFPFTNHQVRLRVFRQRQPRRVTSSQRWFLIRRLDFIPIPSPHRRAIIDLFRARSAASARRPR